MERVARLFEPSREQGLTRACALILCVYAACTFSALAAGLFLEEGMMVVAGVALRFWNAPAGSLLLISVLLTLAAIHVHAVIARHAPPGSNLTFAVPFALVAHLAARHSAGRDAAAWDRSVSFVDTYVTSPAAGLVQIALVCLLWADACRNVHAGLRFRPWWRAVAPWPAVAAFLLPTLAFVGFANATFEHDSPGGVAVAAECLAAALAAALVWGSLLLAAQLVATARRWRRNHLSAGSVEIDGGPSVVVPEGATLFDVLAERGLAPPALCGRRGECSTCLVRILRGANQQLPPRPLEAATLRRLGDPPAGRLACQLYPRELIDIAPIRTAAPAGDRRNATLLDAREVEVVAFAIDLRNSTARLSGLHPYDILSILGAYQSLVRRRIEAAGGHIVSLAGDGVMAIFLTDRDDGANRRALDVASKIASALPTLSQRLPDRTAPLQAGIGIHRGLGLIGIGPADGTLHFFGEPANVASRLEAATKPFGGGTAISRATSQGLRDLQPFRTLSVRMYSDGETIDALLLRHDAEAS